MKQNQIATINNLGTQLKFKYLTLELLHLVYLTCQKQNIFPVVIGQLELATQHQVTAYIYVLVSFRVAVDILRRLGPNFINVLSTAFMHVVPKSVKRLRTSLSLLRFWAPHVLKLYVEC